MKKIKLPVEEMEERLKMEKETSFLAKTEAIEIIKTVIKEQPEFFEMCIALMNTLKRALKKGEDVGVLSLWLMVVLFKWSQEVLKKNKLKK